MVVNNHLFNRLCTLLLSLNCSFGICHDSCCKNCIPDATRYSDCRQLMAEDVAATLPSADASIEPLRHHGFRLPELRFNTVVFE